MRRSALFTLTALFAIWASSPAELALAQVSGNDKDQQEQDAARRRRDAEWSPRLGALPGRRNAGPCPFVKVLYDAARYQEFRDNREASANVGYTGEIQGISAICQYRAAQPIKVTFQVLFALGRGPQAEGPRKTYSYWVAVTDRNRQVLTKEYFSLPADFGNGERILERRDHELTIPRANTTVSGANFEILVGFDVTPQMAAFNREGKRFRVNVAPAVASNTPSQPAQPAPAPAQPGAQ